MTDTAQATDEGTTPTRAARSWWPDQRPLAAGWMAWTQLGLGGFWALWALAELNSFYRSDAADSEAPVMPIAVALAFLASAGLSVSRPGPSRSQVLAYRVSHVALVAFVAAVLVAWVASPS